MDTSIIFLFVSIGILVAVVIGIMLVRRSKAAPKRPQSDDIYPLY